MRRAKKKVTATKARIVAYLTDWKRTIIGRINVPVLFDGQLPDVPAVVQIGKRIAVLTQKSPLAYEDRGEPWRATKYAVKKG